MVTDQDVVRHLITLGEAALAKGERPFAAALVFEERIVDEAVDEVFATHDPTAHAEVVAIRRRCAALSVPHLRGHTLYTLVEPCVMCCGGIHWSKVRAVVFGASQAALQELSKGRPKPGVADVLPLGDRPLEIRGPVLETEVMELLSRYAFRANRI
jgi:tRNA(Arg) A34 adenosine deaminase TadA